MKEPRPTMISARPPERRSTVENSWKTRIGSSELRTVTALVSRMRRRPGGRGREHDGRRRDREVGPMVLAHSEDVEADFVGELDLLDELAQAAGGVASLLAPDVREREYADLHLSFLAHGRSR